jgi:hypothetical protein
VCDMPHWSWIPAFDSPNHSGCRQPHLGGASTGGAEAPARALDARVPRSQQQSGRAQERGEGGSPRRERGEKAPGRNLPRSAGREYGVFTFVIRENLDHTQARARPTLWS